MTTARRNSPGTPTGLRLGRAVAVFASLAASVIHVAAAPSHYTEWWVAGLFFVLIGLMQAGWALLAMVSAGRGIFGLALVLNLGVIGLWVMSRTVGMPIGPSAGVPEEVGRAGVTAVVLEVVVCLAAAHHLLARRHTGGAGAFRLEMGLIGAAGALATGLAMPAVAAAMSHDHSHGPSETGEAQEPGHGDRQERSGAPEETQPGTDSEPAPTQSGRTSEPTPQDDHHDDQPHDH